MPLPYEVIRRHSPIQFFFILIDGGCGMDAWKTEAINLHNAGYSYGRIAEILDKTYYVIRWCIRKSREESAIIVKNDNGTVGIVGDVHAPFNHKNYLTFVRETFKKHNVSQVVFIGDLVDNHAISRHQTEPNAIGAYDEYDKAKTEIEKFVECFPVAKLCIGNHDAIVERQAATIGLGTIFLKNFRDLWGIPNEWEIENEFVVNNVLYKHGVGCGGKDGAINCATQERMSTVIGHQHSFGGCKYIANKRDLIFGLNVGCGIDSDTYAMKYGSTFKYRPTLGCGIVVNENEGYFVPMGKEYL